MNTVYLNIYSIEYTISDNSKEKNYRLIETFRSWKRHQEETIQYLLFTSQLREGLNMAILIY